VSIPWIEDLRAENWYSSSTTTHIDALNKMESALALQERRDPCTVKEIPSDLRELGMDGEPILRGQFDPIENEILIDPLLLSNNRSPYLAMETYFHEARHAYQHFAIEHPEIHADSEQLADWKINDKAYFANIGEDYENYLGKNFEKAFGLIKPLDSEKIEFWKVTERVNNPKNDDPELFKKIT
jgi:hypothetical protein